MYTTLSPCSMCSGAMILFGIKRCVMGENETFVGTHAPYTLLHRSVLSLLGCVGGESILKAHGVEVVNLGAFPSSSSFPFSAEQLARYQTSTPAKS